MVSNPPFSRGVTLKALLVQDLANDGRIVLFVFTLMISLFFRRL